MVNIAPVDAAGGNGPTDQSFPTKVEFELVGETTEFRPHYYPKDVVVGKERQLSEKADICNGEDVADMGGKNREISISGFLLHRELLNYNNYIDSGGACDMIALQWSGEVLLDVTDIDGPVGIDTRTQDWLYYYTMELKSTGTDEGGDSNGGIIDTGATPDTSQ